MASGILAGSGIWEDYVAGWQSSNLQDYLENIALGADRQTNEWVSGGKTENPILDFYSENKNGKLEGNFGDEFWERVYILVESDFYSGMQINAGLVVVPQNFDVEMWNAYRTSSVTLNSTTWTNGDGITVSGFALPLTLKPLESLDFLVTVSEVGPVTIDGSCVFSFGVGDQTLTVVGVRGYAMVTPPDRDGYSEIRWWGTNVFTAQDGTERRMSLMSAAKREVNYSLTANDEAEIHRLENLIIVGSKYVTLQPLWFSKTQLTQATDSLSKTIYLDTVDKELVVDDYILIRLSDLHYDIKKIVTVATGYITVDKEPLVFAVGTAVIPMIRCSPEQITKWAGRRSQLQRFDIKMKEL